MKPTLSVSTKPLKYRRHVFSSKAKGAGRKGKNSGVRKAAGRVTALCGECLLSVPSAWCWISFQRQLGGASSVILLTLQTKTHWLWTRSKENIFDKTYRISSPRHEHSVIIHYTHADEAGVVSQCTKHFWSIAAFFFHNCVKEQQQYHHHHHHQMAPYSSFSVISLEALRSQIDLTRCCLHPLFKPEPFTGAAKLKALHLDFLADVYFHVCFTCLGQYCITVLWTSLDLPFWVNLSFKGDCHYSDYDHLEMLEKGHLIDLALHSGLESWRTDKTQWKELMMQNHWSRIQVCYASGLMHPQAEMRSRSKEGSMFSFRYAIQGLTHLWRQICI